MKIGIIGCGKLGLMVALAIESKGHLVKGYDINPKIATYLRNRKIPFREKGSEELLAKTKIEMVSLEELVQWSDLIMVAVQTPHRREFEGDRPLPDYRSDFDYTYLIEAVKNIDELLVDEKAIHIISTTLPGTINREIKPIISERFKLVYGPLFIAMGQVIDDYLNPEFNLIGVEDEQSADLLEKFYKTINNSPSLRTDITTAEAIKVSYNTFITTKTVLGNLWGEIAHKTGANVDDIYRAWSMATDRLLSSKYLKSGVGDGGGCHPRDNIALSYIADELDLSFNYFEALMKARENHMGWIAKLAIEQAEDLPIFVLGEAFKPETNLTTGSPATLLANIISETHDVTIIPEPQLPLERGVYVVGVKHEMYKDVVFPDGSKIIDPFGIIKDREGIEVTRIGRK